MPAYPGENNTAEAASGGGGNASAAERNISLEKRRENEEIEENEAWRSNVVAKKWKMKKNDMKIEENVKKW